MPGSAEPARARMQQVTGSLSTLEVSEISGCLSLEHFTSSDARGTFAKIYQEGANDASAVKWRPEEVFYSVSDARVIRGLHFQEPPYEQHKLVTCVVGQAYDAVVDLRSDSPTFGCHVVFDLSGASGRTIYVPPGCAHGFASLLAGTVMSYLVSNTHRPEADTGIRWDSAGIDWPVCEPVISERDRSLPRLAHYSSPFKYGPS